MAKNLGKKFENNFKKSCKKQNILCERLIDSNKFDFGKQSRFTPNNPCDFICFDSKNLFYIELKSSKTGSISFDLPPNKTGASIKAHQIKDLLVRSTYKNVFAGLIVWFADRDTKTRHIEGGTYWIEINKFVEWAKGIDKKSINLSDTEKIGIKLKDRKLQVNYEYDIQNLFDTIAMQDKVYETM